MKQSMGGIQDIIRLAPSLDPQLFDSLLLIRLASNAFVPYCSQLELAAFSSGQSYRELSDRTPWDIVAAAAATDYEKIIDAVADALTRIQLPEPFLSRLEKALYAPEKKEGVLQAMIQLLSDVPLDSDCLSHIWERSFPRKIWAAKPKYGDFYTPPDIIDAMLRFIEIPDKSSVYDPCCGSGALLCGAARMCAQKNIRLFGQTLDSIAYRLSHMNLYLRGLSADLGGEPANTLVNDLHAGRKFDRILSNPPFNIMKWGRYAFWEQTEWPYPVYPPNNANFVWLHFIISHLREGGRAAVILPNGALTTQTRSDCAVRKKIVCDHWVEAIIALPPGLFYATKIPCSIWIINKDPARAKVLLVDAREMGLKHDKSNYDKLLELVRQHREGRLNEEKTEWYAAAALEEIAEKKYSLSPNLYTKPKRLSDAQIKRNWPRFIRVINRLCTEFSGDPVCPLLEQWKTANASAGWRKVPLKERYTIYGGVSKRKEDFGDGIPMVDVTTTVANLFVPAALPASVKVSETEIQRYGIQRGDVLLNRSSETMDELACCSVAAQDREAVYGGFVKRLRPIQQDSVDPLYMAGYFRSAIYRREIERVTPVSTTRVNVNNDRLSEIFIYYPDAEMQHRIGTVLLAVFQLKQRAEDSSIKSLWNEFIQLLIEQFITYPVLLAEKETL